jgi:hypothetical protein
MIRNSIIENIIPLSAHKPGFVMISSIEFLMYRISDLLMAPVLLAILFVFFYGFYALGQIAYTAVVRKRSSQAFLAGKQEVIPGYAIHNQMLMQKNIGFDELEVFAFKKMEFLKLVTKVAPMLGLIATMIPMGPALKSLADGNIQGISENLSVAFAGVIFALAAASLTFICASVLKRWLASDLVAAKSILETQAQSDVATAPALAAVKEA